MKGRVFRCILTLAALLCGLCFSAPTASAAKATEEEMLQILQEIPLQSCSYYYETEESKWTTDYTYYSHGLLFQDSSTLSADLAKSSVALSATAYDGSRILALLRNMSFTPLDNSASYLLNANLTFDDPDHVAYTVATATVRHPITEEDYIIYCVPIQGTRFDCLPEWVSDFNMGNGTEHAGFQRASREVAIDLINKFQEDGYAKENRILWLTGHSRGAACANLIAGWFSKDNVYVNQENLFAYTFACPAVSQDADVSLTNIFNFNNPGDLVPMLPLAEWGYYRYGQTFELDTSGPEYVQFNRNFNALTGSVYQGEQSDLYYRPVLATFGKADALAVGLDVLAWKLGNGTRADLVEILSRNRNEDEIPPDEHGLLTVLKIALLKLPASKVTIKIVDIVEYLISTNTQNQELMDFAMQSYAHTLEMAPDSQEFQAYLAANQKTVENLEEVSTVVINSPESFNFAYSRLQDDSNNVVRLRNCLEAIDDLLDDGAGGVATKVSHGHLGATYNLWINTMFYGRDGWKNSELQTELSLNTSFPTKGGHRTFACTYYSLGDNCYSGSALSGKITIPDTISLIGDKCFYTCDGISEIVFPDHLTSIGDYNFYECTGLKTLNLPDALASIGDYAFYNCDGVKTLDLPDVLVTIGSHAFADCDGLTEIRIPDFVESAGNAFTNCRNVTSLTMPCTISYSGYAGLTKLERIRYTKGTTGVMPSNGYKYADNRYQYYAQTNYSYQTLKEIILDEGITHAGSFLCAVDGGAPDALTSVTLPSTLQSIGEHAFYNCRNTVFNEWPKGLTTLGKNAFRYCSKLTSVPSSLTEIGEGCFASCNGLIDIVVPNTVTNIGENAFLWCDNAKTLTVPAELRVENRFCCAGLETIRYTVSGDGVMPDRTGTVRFSVVAGPEYYAKKSLKQIIFDEGVTHIAAYLRGFTSTYDSTNRPEWYSPKSVILPSTLKSVGAHAFNRYNNAVFSEWPEGLTSVDRYAFYGCSQLTSVPLLSGYQERAFSSCTNLKEITIPDDVQYVDKEAFAYCLNLETLTMPADRFFEHAFDGTKAKTIRFTKGATGIMPDRSVPSDKIYKDCPVIWSEDTLETVIFDEGITYIARDLFRLVDDAPRTVLTTVILPTTLESIGDGAFYNCTNLESLSFCRDAVTIGSDTFRDVSTTVYYPQYNDTWTRGIRQNYGGTLTWTPLECTGEHYVYSGDYLAPTCSDPGHTAGSRCAFCGLTFQGMEQIEPTGEHIYPEGPVFRWDDLHQCDAVLLCDTCLLESVHSCEITTATVPATPKEDGSITYSVSFTTGGKTYTDSRVVSVAYGEHYPGGFWHNDANRHWQICLICGAKCEAAEHTAADDGTFCSICGYSLDFPSGLNWLQERLNEPDSTAWATPTFLEALENLGQKLFPSR